MLVEAGDADAIFQTLKQLISDTKQLGRMKVLAREAVKNIHGILMIVVYQW